MKRVFTLGAAVCLSAVAAQADDLSELHPRELQDAVVVAVESNDRRDLMEIMQEMKRRGMWVFETPEQKLCGREPEKVGVLTEGVFRWGAAKDAYGIFLRRHMIETQDCGCLGPSHSYDEFLTNVFGTTAAEMTEEQYIEMREWVKADGYETRKLFRAFRGEFCSG